MEAERPRVRPERVTDTYAIAAWKNLVLWVVDGHTPLEELEPIRVIVRGWNRERLDTRWEFTSRDDLEAVVRIELPPAVADDVLASHDGLVVDYAVNLWWRGY